MFALSTDEFSKKYYDEKWKKQSNKYYCLDCHSGEGQTNQLLNELEKYFFLNNTSKEQMKKEFDFYLEFFLKRCININRSFSDAIKFLSIWLKLSPDTLLNALKAEDLKQYFNRTEFHLEGNKWYFSELLQVFVTLVENKQAKPKEILDHLFKVFNFFSDPECFVCEIIGYDQLERFIKDSPKEFKTDLLLKVKDFIDEKSTVYLGFRSHQYLKTELLTIAPTLLKKIDSKKLASQIKSDLFIFSSINYFDSSKYVPQQSTNFRKRQSY